MYKCMSNTLYNGGNNVLIQFLFADVTVQYLEDKKRKTFTRNKASQAIQSPRTVPFFLLVSLLDGYSFPNVLVKGIVAFKH